MYIYKVSVKQSFVDRSSDERAPESRNFVEHLSSWKQVVNTVNRLEDRSTNNDDGWLLHSIDIKVIWVQD